MRRVKWAIVRRRRKESSSFAQTTHSNELTTWPSTFFTRMALKVLLVGLNYTKDGKLKQLSVQSLVAFQKCLMEEMGYTPSNFKFMVDEDS
jgi:hypothetical protein